MRPYAYGWSRDSTAVRQAQLMGLDLNALTTLCVVDFAVPRPDDAKSILRDVVSVVVTACQSIREVINRLLVSLHQLVERRQVPLLTAFDYRFFFRRHVQITPRLRRIRQFIVQY